jgi:regulator of sigma E protease
MNIILNLVQGAFFSIVPFVILLGILVFVHEFGHFIVARLNGVRVEVFSLGFGKKIFQYKRGDTNYCISIVPLGGYVKMFGDQPGAEVSEADKAHSFTHKNVWRRISIVLAGPLMNFFFAVLVFFIVAIIGEDFRTTAVGDISPETKAYQFGLRSGDKVVAVNDTAITTWDELDSRLAELHDQQAILQVQRADTPSPIAVKVDVAAKPNPNVLSTDPIVGEVEGLTSLSKATRVGVMKNSPLAAAGLKSGDIITAVNGTKVSYWRELDSVLQKQDTKAPLVLDIERYPTSESESVDSAEVSKSETMSLTLAPIGLAQYSMATLKIENSEVYLGAVIKDSPAEAAGLLPGDRLVKMNTIKINQWDDVVAAVKTYDGKNPVQVHVDRNGESLSMSIVPKLFTQMTAGGLEESRYSIGIKPYVNYANPEVINVSTSDLGKALKLGTKRTWDVSVMTVMSFVRLIQGRVSPKNIGGVISIGKAASETFKIGASQFLRMMGLISVNLFILNLLPIPVLDGGHLLFYLIEGVKGAPVSIKKMEYAQQIGMFLLMGLMVLALFNDFSRLFHL